MVGTGAVPVQPPDRGLDALGPDDGVHVLHSMGDTFALDRHLDSADPKTAIIVGAGYVGLEMAEGTHRPRHRRSPSSQRGPKCSPPLDPELGALVHTELDRPRRQGPHRTSVDAVTSDRTAASSSPARHLGAAVQRTADLVLVVVGVRPNTEPPRARRGAASARDGAVVVDETMRTGLPHVFAAGDGVVTHHRLLGTDLPAARHDRPQAGPRRRRERPRRLRPLRRQRRHAGREGLRPRRRPHRAPRARSDSPPDSRPSARPPSPTTTRRTTRARSRSRIRITGDADTGRLLGAQLVGASAPRPPNASTPTPPRCSTA